jgi:hypothetical protein
MAARPSCIGCGEHLLMRLLASSQIIIGLLVAWFEAARARPTGMGK